MKLTAQTRNDILAAIVAATGPFDPAGVFVGVAQAVVNNGLGTVMADVTPATGGAGVRKPVTTWSAGYVLVDGRAVADGPAMSFRPAPGDPGQQVQAWYMADALTAGVLIAWGDLPGLVMLPDDKSSVTVIPRITVDPDGRWSEEVVYNG